MTLSERLKSLGITLPATPKPIAAYVPAVVADNFVFTSGQLPIVNGQLQYRGKLGSEITKEQGYEAAKICALNALSAIASVIGDLDRVSKAVKVVGYVASAPGFTEQPAVVNGASDLLRQLFGENGAHARSAVGVAELPLGAPVEIELIVMLK